MKMGVKEFKERISEVTERGEPVIVTHHGRTIANYFPRKPKDPKKIKEAADAIRKWQDDMKIKGIDLDAVLAERGIDPWGEQLNDNPDH
jgi:antitoxin (DNA-binding transcriptional repressor) of toxin-antitoxin stability system